MDSNSDAKAVAQQGHNLVAVIQEQVKQLEATLQEGERLIVYCDAGREQIRVETFTFPNWHLAMVGGFDDQGNRTRRIENVQDIKLTCKIVKSQQKSAKIGFILPTKTVEASDAPQEDLTPDSSATP